MSITFAELAEFLRHGREIEFRYNDKDYSITNSHYEWHFCCDTDGTSLTLCAFPEFDVLVEKTGSFEIEGISIKEIFNKQIGNLEMLDIL